MALIPPSMTISFSQFRTLCEKTYDKDLSGYREIQGGEGGRLHPARKKEKQDIKRTKAIGGGKTAPVQYKDRKDIGTNKPKKASELPQKERGSAALSPKEAQRKAYRERKAREAGGTTKTADQLLHKKHNKPKADPNYKPQKASGYTRQERMKITRKGETELRGIMKKQETDKYKKETGQNPDKKGKTTVMSRVHKRMSS